MSQAFINDEFLSLDDTSVVTHPNHVASTNMDTQIYSCLI